MPLAVDGIIWSCSETLFMCYKAVHFNDMHVVTELLEHSERIQPAEAKALGRSIKDYNDAEWATVRYDAMLSACLRKYMQYEDEFDRFFTSLGNQKVLFIEASPFDAIWGVGMNAEVTSNFIRNAGEGNLNTFITRASHDKNFNLLGQVWTAIYNMHVFKEKTKMMAFCS